MFEYVTRTMPSKDGLYYRNEVLPFIFREFIELRYGFDPTYEEKVLRDLIYNLIAHSLCLLGDYAARAWKESYSCNILDVEFSPLYTSGDYAGQLETMFRLFESNGTGEFEMIRMAVCYVKVKRLNLKNVFPNRYIPSEVKEPTDENS